MNINKRVEHIINTLYKGNKRAFATAISVSPTVIENVVGSRQGKPSFDVLCKICSNANISTDWLLLGKGEMISGSSEAVATINSSVANNDVTQSSQEIINTQKELIDTQKELIQSLKQRLRDAESKHITASQTSTFRSVQSADTATGKYHKK